MNQGQREASWPWVPQWLEGEIWHYPFAYRTFKKYIPSGSRVLEVGFGSGRMLARLARELGGLFVGVDIEDSAFPCLAFFSQGASVEAVKGSGFCLPFPDHAFDVVYSEGVIEHFPPAQAQALVEEKVRVCRPRGWVIISVPNRWALVHSLTKAILGEGFIFYPERSLTPAQLCRLMEAVGLRVIHRDGFAFGCQFYLFTTLVLSPHLPPRLREAFSRALARFSETTCYHFNLPRLDSRLGFQTLAVGEK